MDKLWKLGEQVGYTLTGFVGSICAKLLNGLVSVERTQTINSHYPGSTHGFTQAKISTSSLLITDLCTVYPAPITTKTKE